MKRHIKTMAIMVITLIVIIVGIKFLTIDATSKINRIILTPKELNQRLQSEKEDVLIIDLRDLKDYKESHIEGAVNMPFNDEGVKLLNYLKNKDAKKVPIYLICYSGNRSAKAFNLLAENNYTNLSYVKFGFEEFALKMANSVFFETGECPCKDE